MEDNSIVDLYWARSEDAITETSEKYGKYCYAIAYNILSNAEDADESVNDTYLDAWHNMPPHRPAILSTFLGKITRRISIDKWRGRAANKRGGGEITEFYNMTIALGSYGNDDFQAEVFGNIPEEKLQEAHSAFAENQRNLRVETKDGLRFFIAFYPSYNWIYGGGTMSYFKIDNQMRNWIERNVG